jgi:hypothetical protein
MEVLRESIEQKKNGDKNDQQEVSFMKNKEGQRTE